MGEIVEVPLKVLTPDELRSSDLGQEICGVSCRGSHICTKPVSHIGPHVAHLLKEQAVLAWIRVGDFAIDDIITDLQRIREDTA